MGSVISEAVCPKCGNEEMYDEFWYKSNEEMQFCEQCGYSRSSFIKRGDDGKFLKDEKGNPIWVDEENPEPIGAYRVSYDNNTSLVGSIPKDVDIEQWKKDMIECYTGPTDKEISDSEGEQRETENCKVVSFIISEFIDGHVQITKVF